VKKRISFIVNPISGTRKKDALPEIIRRHIDGARFEIEIFFTERSGHAFELAQQQMKDGVPYIVAVGGDGTVNEVAAALRDSPSAMGIVPCGSGNGLARHLHIPLNLQKALKALNVAGVKEMDYGLANGRPFFCTLGTGFDARVSDVFAHTRKRGLRKYIAIIAREFIAYRAREYALNIDGTALAVKAMVVTVANSSQYGNNACISPLADISDGKLDVCIVRPFPKILAAGLAFRLIGKSIHKSRFYSSYRGKEIVIVRQKDDTVHLDGDPFTMEKELKISVAPRGLKVLTPLAPLPAFG
jgi:YegS/Rv2252/BmrU family lipid kinase